MARYASAAVITGHVRIAGKPAGEVIQALAAAVRAGRRGLALHHEAIAAAAGGNFLHRGRDIGHHPVHEIAARLVTWHAHVAAADRLRHGRHVRVHAHQQARTGAGRRPAPGQVRVAVRGEAVGVAGGELAVDRRAVGQAVAAQLHCTLLTLPGNPGAPQPGGRAAGAELPAAQPAASAARTGGPAVRPSHAGRCRSGRCAAARADTGLPRAAWRPGPARASATRWLRPARSSPAVQRHRRPPSPAACRADHAAPAAGAPAATAGAAPTTGRCPTTAASRSRCRSAGHAPAAVRASAAPAAPASAHPTPGPAVC
ncbi:hypothetical protein G6F65_016837 [Rhizopus arrhizus]|nr:hypothetical protein G6F65_016837 [Rhizopus arrhizus]